MLDGAEWRESIFDFYTLDGALALARPLRTLRPVAGSSCTSSRCRSSARSRRWSSPSSPTPSSASAGIRDRVELVYVTPLPGAFTKPIASQQLGGMLDDRKIALEPDFVVERIDAERQTLVSYDEREVPFDLLVTVPLNMGADYVARSGLGDELNYVPVDKHTLLSTAYDNIFAARRRLEHPGLEGRLGRALLGRDLRRQLRRSTSTGGR